MGFIKFIASLIAKEVVSEVSAQLRVEREKQTKINAIGSQAKDLTTEWDNAQSESERVAIMRKMSNFADISKQLL